MFIKRIFSTTILITTLVFSSFPLAQAADTSNFSDLSSDNWAFQSVNDMTKRGVVSGYEDGSFRPQKSITREELAKLICSTFNLELTPALELSFNDVQADRWSYRFVETAKEYLTGYYPPKGKAFFDPESNATREDVAVALTKVLGYKKTDLQNSNILEGNFKDSAKISAGIKSYVAIAFEKKLISGYEDRTFRPDQPITRAEVVSLLYKSIKSTSGDQGSQVELTAELFGIAGFPGTYDLYGKTDPHATVTANGQKIDVDSKGNFSRRYKLVENKTYTFSISATLNGKTNTIEKQLKNKIDSNITENVYK